MKKIVLISSIILLFSNLKAQESQIKSDSLPVFNEASLSINRTYVSDTNTTDKFGFGIGIYHTFREGKKLNLKTGVEFNRTTQFKEIIFEGDYILFSDTYVYERTYVNSTYHLNCLSVPFNVKYNFGKKQNFFLESGVYADIMFNAQRDAFLYGVEYKDTAFIVKNEEVQESVNLVNTFGVSVGLGMKFPIGKYEIILKPELKYALRKVYNPSNDLTDMYNHYAKISIGFKW